MTHQACKLGSGILDVPANKTVIKKVWGQHHVSITETCWFYDKLWDNCQESSSIKCAFSSGARQTIIEHMFACFRNKRCPDNLPRDGSDHISQWSELCFDLRKCSREALKVWPSLLSPWRVPATQHLLVTQGCSYLYHWFSWLAHSCQTRWFH